MLWYHLPFVTSLYYVFKISSVSLSVCYVIHLFSASAVSSSVCYARLRHYIRTISSRFPLFRYLFVTVRHCSVLGFSCLLFCLLRRYSYYLQVYHCFTICLLRHGTVLGFDCSIFCLLSCCLFCCIFCVLHFFKVSLFHFLFFSIPLAET